MCFFSKCIEKNNVKEMQVNMNVKSYNLINITISIYDAIEIYKIFCNFLMPKQTMAMHFGFELYYFLCNSFLYRILVAQLRVSFASLLIEHLRK